MVVVAFFFFFAPLYLSFHYHSNIFLMACQQVRFAVLNMKAAMKSLFLVAFRHMRIDWGSRIRQYIT